MIKAIGLTKRYRRTLAVDGLSFTAEPGRVTGLLGPHGAGKSTVIRLAVGLRRPDAGTVLLGGRPYREFRHPLRTVGALVDPTWLHPRRSVRAHLTWLARTQGLSPRRVDDVLDVAGLTDSAGTKAVRLTLESCQRLGMAAALIGDPRILLLDEPFRGLDPDGMRWLHGLLRRLAAEGRTVLVSSHLLGELTPAADDLVSIDGGRLVQRAATTDILQQATANAVLVRSPYAERLRTALAEAEIAAVEEEHGALLVSGATPERVGDLAATHAIVLHELRPVSRPVRSLRRRTAETATHSGSDLVRTGE